MIKQERKKGASVVFGNFAADSQYFFTPSSDEDAVGTIEQLMSAESIAHNGNPCEWLNVPLDGNSNLLDADDFVGFISQSISDDSGKFDEDITLSFDSDTAFESQGITIIFDKKNNIYPKRCTIYWYLNGEEVNAREEQIMDASFDMSTDTIKFDAVVVKFNDLNIGGNRLRIESFGFGYYHVFSSNDLQKVSVIQEIDLISSSLPISTTDIVIKADVSRLLFQKKQPLLNYFNGQIVSKTFISDVNRTSKNEWRIKTEDYIGIMDDVMFYGGFYENKPTVELLQEIFETADVEYSIDEALNDSTLSGFLPYSSCRTALMKVCFGCGAIVDTSYSELVNVKVLDKFGKKEPINIPLERIYANPKYDISGRLSSFELEYNTYNKTDEEVVIYDRTGDNIEGYLVVEIVLDEPYHDIYLDNAGSILQRNGNFLQVQLGRTSKVLGKKCLKIPQYKKIENSAVIYADSGNQKQIKDVSIIDMEKVDSIASLCYNYFAKEIVASMKIAEKNVSLKPKLVKFGQAKYGEAKYGQLIEGQSTEKEIIHLSDSIIYDTEYLGKNEGRVQKQTFMLDGNFLVKNCTVR